MARKVKDKCLICGKRVEDGRAVFTVGVDVDRPAERYSDRNHHVENGTVSVTFKNRSPRGVVHEDCITAVLYPKEERKRKVDPRVLKDDHREWDE